MNSDKLKNYYPDITELSNQILFYLQEYGHSTEFQLLFNLKSKYSIICPLLVDRLLESLEQQSLITKQEDLFLNRIEKRMRRSF